MFCLVFLSDILYKKDPYSLDEGFIHSIFFVQADGIFGIKNAIKICFSMISQNLTSEHPLEIQPTYRNISLRTCLK